MNDKRQAIEAVEERAWAARITMSALCKRANVNQSMWSRCKAKGSIGVKALARMEDAMDKIEAERRAA